MKKKEKFIKRKLFLIMTFITSSVYIGWRVLFTIPTKYGIVALISGIALVTAEIIGFLEAVEHYRNMSAAKEPERPEIPVSWYPEVDVFIATHNETTELLFKTINGCIHMKYPDKKKVHIYVCDDNNRPEMRELAEKMGVGYFGLSENKHAKAGNLNNALGKTYSPLVVTFDADMIPTSDFLTETVPYFYLPRMFKDSNGVWQVREHEDKEFKIGFIQTPQSFYNPDLFQYNLYSERRIPNEQDYFFREVNVGRNRTNSPIYAGTNTVISREALEMVGGIKTGSITEDFATGIMIQSKGYTCYAISKILAHGLAPTDINSLLRQRERWGRGCIQSFKSINVFFNKNIKLGTKLSYFYSLMYWWTFLRRFIYIVAPIMFTVFNIRVVETSLLEILLIWLPSYLFYNTALRLISSNIRNQRWSNVVDTIIFPYLIMPMILESIGIKLKKFAVTNKNRLPAESSSRFKYAIPHIFLLAFTFIGLYSAASYMSIFGITAYIVPVYWLLFNSYGLTMAILFMMGRKNYRQEERYYAQVDVVVKTFNDVINARTYDISESGLSVILDFPEYIPYDRDCSIIIKNEKYTAELKARVVHVAQQNVKFKYSFHITSMTEENKREYFQLVYDREHSLPMFLHPSLSIIDDLNVNVKGRLNKNTFSERKLPRISVDRELRIEGIGKAKLVDFNYEYLLLEMPHGMGPADSIAINLGNDIAIRGVYDRQLSARKSKSQVVYKVENLDELTAKLNFKSIPYKLVSAQKGYYEKGNVTSSMVFKEGKRNKRRYANV